jgi:hypothetical protein
VRVVWGYSLLHALIDTVTVAVLFRAAGLYGVDVSTLA